MTSSSYPRHLLSVFLPARSSGRATASTTSSQILLSRGVAALDPEQTDCSVSTFAAPLVTILENASVHILYVGPSSAPEVTRLTAERPARFEMDPLERNGADDTEALAVTDDANAPLRPKASPRSTPSISARSSFSFGSASEQSAPGTPSSEDGSPIRGRTLARVPAHERPEPRAMTRLQAGPNVADLDSVVMRQRLMSRDLCEEPDDIDGSYIEPLPYERFRSSLSEELHKVVTSDSSIDLTNFGGHRDTFALFGLRRKPIKGPELPGSFFQRLLKYINFSDYKTVRLSCRCWSAGITRARPVVMPSVYRLPAELLEKVYACLSPIDLNASRRSCRAWMIGSLEERLLTRVLKEGGWWRAAKADMDLYEEIKGHRTPDSINEEWLLSKRLATECSLQPNWTGNGLTKSLLSASGSDSVHESMVLTSKTDFSELSAGYYPHLHRRSTFRHGSAVHFTVSVCGKFVLVTEGCLIYIYSLRDSSNHSHVYGGHLSPVTTVVCPHRVLAVSMDTSSQRFAVAALLEGRVGLVCDLREKTPLSSKRHSTPQGVSNLARDCRSSNYSSLSSGDPLLTEAASPYQYTTIRSNHSDIALARAIPESSLSEVQGPSDVLTSWGGNAHFLAPEADPYRNHSANTAHIPPETDSRSIGSSTHTDYMPLKSGIRAIYRNLCSVQDPPRSVAICPQRRCVAFGCSAGIELHWIDALTGQDLNRWFPLTAPSDFLYFLPPRPGVDSAKKLRLISSPCHPREKEGLWAKFFPETSTTLGGHHGMTWDEWWSEPSTRDNAWRRSAWCDHYRAVPISDGWSVLFIDPAEGNLCLGSDAPLGARVTKLTRRFVFKGPSESGKPVIPNVYAAGGELRWGVRVAVGYEEAIWLFVVPPDVLFDADSKTAEVQEEQDDDDADEGEENLVIEGIRIGHMQGLVDLAVDTSGGDLTIWSFAADGMAYVWQLAGRSQAVKKRVVLQDGTVRPQVDADGDTYMSNTSQRAMHFDGAEPVRPTYPGFSCLPPCPQQPTHDLLFGLQSRVIDHGHLVDRDGDITMLDAAAEDEGYVSGEDDDDENGNGRAGRRPFAIHASPLWDRWSDGDAEWVPDYLAQRGAAGIEEGDEGLAGDVLELTRLEVEVLCG